MDLWRDKCIIKGYMWHPSLKQVTGPRSHMSQYKTSLNHKMTGNYNSCLAKWNTDFCKCVRRNAAKTTLIIQCNGMPGTLGDQHRTIEMWMVRVKYCTNGYNMSVFRGNKYAEKNKPQLHIQQHVSEDSPNMFYRHIKWASVLFLKLSERNVCLLLCKETVNYKTQLHQTHVFTNYCYIICEYACGVAFSV